jgi:hypothetical protein
VDRKALSGRTVLRIAKPSGRAVLRTGTLEAERKIGSQGLRVALSEGTQGSKADWFERRQECSSEHVVLGPASAHLAPLLMPAPLGPRGAREAAGNPGDRKFDDPATAANPVTGSIRWLDPVTVSYFSDV